MENGVGLKQRGGGEKRVDGSVCLPWEGAGGGAEEEEEEEEEELEEMQGERRGERS